MGNRKNKTIWYSIGVVAFWACLTMASETYQIGINLTNSLPHKIILIHKYPPHKMPPIKRGDLVIFHWEHPQKKDWYPDYDQARWIKIVAGVPGDVVSQEGDRYYVEGIFVGELKKESKKGIPLEPGPTGVLPEGYYYLYGTNENSLDSRYRIIGWVPKEKIIGKGYVLY